MNELSIEIWMIKIINLLRLLIKIINIMMVKIKNNMVLTQSVLNQFKLCIVNSINDYNYIYIK
jgi:hypothetical protein